MSPVPKSEELETSDEVTLKYKEILRSNGVTDEVSGVIVQGSGLQGEGFASATKCVTIKFENPSLKPLNLFVKSHTASGAHTEMLTEGKLFEKESRFFMEYVPAAKEFCKSKGYDDLVDMYPKCYYGDENMVVFENLVVEKGYELLNKVEQQDLDAVRFAIKTLAKHHAISYALIHEMGGPENFFKKFPNLDFECFNIPNARTMMEPMMNNGINTNVKLLQRNKNSEDNDEAINFLNSHQGKAFDEVLNIIKCNPAKEKLLVLGHGDYWNNNMMFLKNKETNQIIGHLAIDLQVTRYNCPCLDIAYYLFTSVKPEIRKNHLYEILGRYFDILKHTAAKLGHPIDLSFEDLYTMYREKVMLGFWFATCLASTAGYAVVKDIDVNGLSDMKDFAVQFDKLLQQWIVNNPKEASENAKSVLDLVNECKALSLSA
ncbi:putative oxidoreductase dhs-27 [Orchesella cincta]|uniref:Putative oxidoreductase dhs-27 n=1 Tax=Orchesella cincta TaxID=48709 RepID=A0A1D2NAX5_ORCCI|nr:putative oxidoreductase dhs-27 [Orchesella cincta]